MLMVLFANMTQDLGKEIRKVAAFLGKNLTDEQVDLLVEHLRFDKLKNNEFVNKEGGKKSGSFNIDGNFMRRGSYI